MYPLDDFYNDLFFIFKNAPGFPSYPSVAETTGCIQNSCEE